MKDKVLLGILIILIVILAMCVGVDSANVDQIMPETNSTVNEVKNDASNVEVDNILKEDYITADELIYSNKYLIKDKAIYRIAPKTSIEEFNENIEVTKGKEVKIYKGEKEITSGYIGTGMLVKDADGQEYTTSVTGDIVGDGVPNQVELTILIRHLIELKGWQLEGIEKASGDITGDGQINLVDISKLINYIVYEEWEKEEIKTPKEPTITVITKKDENKDYYIGAVELKIEEDKSTQNSKTTYTITGSKEQKETVIKEGEIITLTGEGEYLITAYTYGIKGNKSKGANKIIKLKDPTPNLTEGNTIITHTPTEWTKSSVTVKIETKIEGYTLQYSKDGVKWEDYTKEIEVVQNGKIYARLRDNLGNVGNNVVGSIENIDKVAPTVTLAPNGGASYTMPSTGDAKINTIITATDPAKTETNGCSGLNTLKYAWSQSRDIEPETWTDFTNGSKVEKTDITTPGTWYLWTKVIDRAGNEAESVKVSNPFIIKSNTDVANQITLTPNKTEWTNTDVTVTASFGENLVQNKTLICSGTAGTDYTINGVSSAIVKTNGETVTAIARDAAGNTVGKELTIDNIDKVAPTVNLAPNGGENYIMPVEGKAKISTTLTATDTGGSNLNTLQYAWSQSKQTEPTTWMTFTNGSAVSKIDISTSGTWYLWTKVTDKAGNRAENVKVSNPFIVKPNTDEANQIILTQNPKSWTNGDVTVTVNFGANLVQDKTLVCTGTVGTDYTVNGTESVVVKTNGKTVTCAAKDIEGNIVSKTLTIVNIDKTLPTINSLTANPSTWTNGNVTLTGNATDSQSGIVAYQFSQEAGLTASSGGWTNITATTAQTTQTKEVSLAGTWYFYVKDLAGNVNKSSVVVKIDKTVPTIDITANPASWTNQNVTLTAKATDSQSGIVAYQFSQADNLTASSDGWTSITATTTQITQTKVVTATETWYFYAKDAVGNVNKKSVTARIDRIIPEITVPSSTIVGNTVNVEASDADSGISYWTYGASSSVPTTWTPLTNAKEITIPFIPTLEGTYYIFVKDAAGNVNSAPIVVEPARWNNARLSTNYTTLEEALLDASSEDTLTLLADYNDSSETTISSNKIITLNTNGKTLTKSINTIRIDSGSTLNVNGNGTIQAVSSEISLFFNFGTLNINDGTIRSDYGVIWNQEGNLNIRGGTLTGGTSSGSTTFSGIVVIEADNVNISGGTIAFGGVAIELRGNANITVTGEKTVVSGGTKFEGSAIYCTDESSGTINIGTTSPQNKDTPHIIGGIDNQSTDVKVNIHSGKVD